MAGGVTHISFVSLLLALLATAQAVSAPSEFIVRADADTAVLRPPQRDTCGPTLIEHYTRNLLHELPPYDAKRFLLVTQRFHVGTGCLEGNDPASVDVEGRPIDVKTGTVDPHPTWSFTTAGTEGGLDSWESGPLYRVNMRGCCAAESTAKYFSLNTGKLVASSTVPLLELQITDAENDRLRFIGAESNIAASPQARVKAMATLFFGDEDGVLQTVAISSHEPYGREEWGVTELTLPNRQQHIGVRSAEKTTLHVVLGCRGCDSAPVDLTVPISGTGVDTRSVISSGPSVDLSVQEFHRPETRGLDVGAPRH